MKLTLDLVPQTCWFSNVRSACTKEQWNIVRKEVYKLANYKCEICNGIGDQHPVEAHEIWQYKNNTQKLIGLIALCPLCHSTKHYGYSIIQGKEQQVLNHLMKVNDISKSEAIDVVKCEFEIWKIRSQQNWKLNINFLKKFGIDVKKIKKV